MKKFKDLNAVSNDGFKSEKLIKTSKHRKIFKIFSMILLFVLILYLPFYSFFPDTNFKIFGFRTYLISYTKSMEPSLSYYDMIFVQKCDINKLKEGDVITFKAHKLNTDEQMVITHRIIKITVDEKTNKIYLRTKGDARNMVDEIPVTIDGENGTNTLIGKYMFKSVVLGRISGYIQSEYAIFSAFSIASYLILLYILSRPKDENLTESENS